MYLIRLALRRVLPQLYVYAPQAANSLNISSSLFFRNFTTRKSLKNKKVSKVDLKKQKQNPKKNPTKKSYLRGRSSLAAPLPGSEEYELACWGWRFTQRLFKKQLREFKERELEEKKSTKK